MYRYEQVLAEGANSPRLSTLDKLNTYLFLFMKVQERNGKPTRLILVTYNRVGEGFLEPRTIKGGLTLDVYSSPGLAVPEVARFYAGVKDELAKQILLLDCPTFFIIYAGEGDRFEKACELIEKLSFLAGAVGKRELAKFYLLTCNCDLPRKVDSVGPLYRADLLRHLVCNPGGNCGGFADLQTVADKALAAVEVK